MSHVTQHSIDTSRYAKTIEVSKRIRWDTDRDVICGRQFDFGKKFLPDGLSKVAQVPFLSADEKRLFSQVQGRTYANMFALVERFIGAKVLEISRGSSIEPETLIDPLWKDIFLFHWKEESQHAIVDEMEWMRENEKIDAAQRDQAVGELIGLVGAVDGIVQMQAKADAEYFAQVAGRVFDAGQTQAIHATMLAAYRWQYIVTGVQDPRFLEVLGSMINAEHGARIHAALGPIVGAVH